MKKITALFILILTLSVQAEQVSVTGVFFDVMGKVTINGEPAPAGSRINAYSESGILCGQSEVKIPGYFGILHIYADDPVTDVVDGVKKGEKVVFRVDGNDLNSDQLVEYSKPYETFKLYLDDGIKDMTPPSVSKCVSSEQTLTIHFNEPVNHLRMKDKDNYQVYSGIENISVGRDFKSINLVFESEIPSSVCIKKLYDIFGNVSENVIVSVN